jgi:hypothetical protein
MFDVTGALTTNDTTMGSRKDMSHLMPDPIKEQIQNPVPKIDIIC